MGKEFRGYLRVKKIALATYEDYGRHQNGVVKRNWRNLFEQLRVLKQCEVTGGWSYFMNVIALKYGSD